MLRTILFCLVVLFSMYLADIELDLNDDFDSMSDQDRYRLCWDTETIRQDTRRWFYRHTGEVSPEKLTFIHQTFCLWRLWFNFNTLISGPSCAEWPDSSGVLLPAPARTAPRSAPPPVASSFGGRSTSPALPWPLPPALRDSCSVLTISLYFVFFKGRHSWVSIDFFPQTYFYSISNIKYEYITYK